MNKISRVVGVRGPKSTPPSGLAWDPVSRWARNQAYHQVKMYRDDMNDDLLPLFLISHGHTTNERCRSSLYHSHFNIENSEESVISETSKYLNNPNTYDRNFVQRTNMVALVYKHTWSRLTTVYPCVSCIRGVPGTLRTS